MTLKKGKVWSKPSVTEQRFLNTRQEVTFGLGHFRLDQVHLGVWDRDLAWIGSGRITSPQMENVGKLT